MDNTISRAIILRQFITAGGAADDDPVQLIYADNSTTIGYVKA